MKVRLCFETDKKVVYTHRETMTIKRARKIYKEELKDNRPVNEVWLEHIDKSGNKKIVIMLQGDK